MAKMTAAAIASTTQIRRRICTLNQRARVDARTLNEARHSFFSIESLGSFDIVLTPVHYAASTFGRLGTGYPGISTSESI